MGHHDALSEEAENKIVNDICDLLHEGWNLAESIEIYGVAEKTFHRILVRRDDLRQQYRASHAYMREMGADNLEQRILKDDILRYHDQQGNERLDGGSVTHKNNTINHLKWLYSKTVPKYRDKLDIEHKETKKKVKKKTVKEIRKDLDDNF